MVQIDGPDDRYRIPVNAYISRPGPDDRYRIPVNAYISRPGLYSSGFFNPLVEILFQDPLEF